MIPSRLLGTVGKAAAAEANRVTVGARERLTGNEVFFKETDVIVSKTDVKGLITYANETFLNISGFREDQLIGAPHSILRHPHMPRCVFKFLWDNIGTGEEVFAYVLNRAKNGDHYWVFAHVTATRDANGTIIGYHSNRRVPERKAIETIAPIYKSLLDVEKAAATPQQGLENSFKALVDFVVGTGLSYSELVFSL